MKKNLTHLGEDESQSKMERSSPRRLRKKNVLAISESIAEPCRCDRALYRKIVNRGTQIPKLKSKLDPQSDSSRITDKKVKKRISRTERIQGCTRSKMVQGCNRSTQTLDTIFPPPPYQPSVVYCGPGGVYCGPSSIAVADKMANVEKSKNQKNHKQHTLSKSPSTKNASKDKLTGKTFNDGEICNSFEEQRKK